jgi:hypothetical protein
MSTIVFTWDQRSMRLGRVKRGLVPHDQWNVLEVSDVGNRLLAFHAGGLDRIFIQYVEK